VDSIKEHVFVDLADSILQRLDDAAESTRWTLEEALCTLAEKVMCTYILESEYT
jgi:hypothetical protein